MSRKCVLHTETGLCVNTINDVDETYSPPDGYSVAPDNTGEIFWYWDGDNWYNPTNQYLNAYLGQYPTADSPELNDETNRLATTFWVREKIQDYIENVWLVNGILDGGSFSDPAPTILLNAGYFDDTGINLNDDISSPVFNNTGGNLTADITVSGY